MIYQLSDNAFHSFQELPGENRTPVLIFASTEKIKTYWADTDSGRAFFSGLDGVEKRQKLNDALSWIRENDKIWAPVIDLVSSDPKKFFFADGRHTFVALEINKLKCIQVAVPDSRVSVLSDLLRCEQHDHT